MAVEICLGLGETVGMPSKKSKSFDLKKDHTIQKRIEKRKKRYQNFKNRPRNKKVIQLQSLKFREILIQRI